MRPMVVEPSTRSAEEPVVVRLVGGPSVSVGAGRHAVPEGSKRLLAFVALERGTVERGRTAGVLWPTVEDGRVAGNLRSALWRLRGAGIDVLVTDKLTLSLKAGV